MRKNIDLRKKSLRILPIFLMAVLTLSAVVQAQPTVTTCTSGFSGADIAIRKISPFDAFIPIPGGGSVVKHISNVTPGNGACTIGTITDIALPSGNSASWGATLDNSGILYVTAGSDVFHITNILAIPPPYTSPTIFYNGGTNFRSLAIRGNTLYAADFGAGNILSFDLTIGPSSNNIFASVPGVFGLIANGTDDLFVTSNGGFTGVTTGVGDNTIKNVKSTGVTTIANTPIFPEGLGGDSSNLYIAAGGFLFTVPISGGTVSPYAGNSPIQFTHGVTVWKGAGYVTDSHGSGEVHKFTLLP